MRGRSGRTPFRHRRRRLAVALGAPILFLAALLAVVCWFLSSLLLDPHHDLVRETIRVEAAGNGSVTLARTKASARDGVFGLDWTGGHAIAGTITARDGTTVTRKLSSTTGALRAGTKVALDPDVWEGTPRSALRIPFSSVDVPDQLGPMPAWYVRGRGSTWVLFVHGIDGTRAGGLRPLRTLHDAKLPSLLISYRNDAGAPRSPDRYIHLGMTEWEDLDAAARWAVARGARRLVLYGDSMGGSIVTRFMHESQLASRVVALVLDAPVLDWRAVISAQAHRFHLPLLGAPVRWAIGARIDVSWGALDEIAQASSFHVPILLFQGLADPLVPPADSRAFAARVPQGQATFEGFAGAGHIQSWNVDPARYERTLAAFLARVVR
jgi:pimeloyl-ACP methyl ester carboxylesterase